MFHSNQRGQGGGLIGLLSGLATVTALCGTVFIGPLVFPAIESPVMHRLHALYGFEAAFWLGWAVHILTYPLSFLAIRLGLMAGLSALSVFATNRLI